MFWYWPPIVFFVFWLYIAWDRGRQVRRLPRLLEIEPEASLPQLSVVIPARNEERRLRDCLDSLLANEYPDLQIICVDDRSTDSTGQILDEYARRHPSHVRVIHNVEVPAGWLGKCHAISRGSAEADGEFILFTDADVVFSPGALVRAVSHAMRGRVDMVVALPEMITHTAGERAFGAVFSMIFLLKFEPERAMRPRSTRFIGVGAFNMVRRSFYELIGGHRFLRLQVVDDIGLGKIMKRAGGIVRVVDGSGAVRVRWQESLGQLITGLEKNAFASMNYAAPRAIVASVLLFLATWWGVIGLFIGPFGARVLSLALFLLTPVLLYASFRRRSPVGGLYLLAFPIGALMLCWALLRSTFLTIRQGGVRWRDDFYPLEELRKYRL